MGTRGPWLGFTAERDEWDGASTVVFAHAPESAASHHWFVRSEPIPSVAFSWAFFEEFGVRREVVRLSVPGGRGRRGVGE